MIEWDLTYMLESLLNILLAQSIILLVHMLAQGLYDSDVPLLSGVYRQCAGTRFLTRLFMLLQVLVAY